MNARADILQEAESLVNGDRNIQYGDPSEDFRRTAELWSAWKGVDFETHEVAIFMALLKISRLKWTPEKRDSWADLIGYGACGWHCVAPPELKQEEVDAVYQQYDFQQMYTPHQVSDTVWRSGANASYFPSHVKFTMNGHTVCNCGSESSHF